LEDISGRALLEMDQDIEEIVAGIVVEECSLMVKWLGYIVGPCFELGLDHIRGMCFKFAKIFIKLDYTRLNSSIFLAVVTLFVLNYSPANIILFDIHTAYFRNHQSFSPLKVPILQQYHPCLK
jgi:hypothetical protein